MRRNVKAYCGGMDLAEEGLSQSSLIAILFSQVAAARPASKLPEPEYISTYLVHIRPYNDYILRLCIERKTIHRYTQHTVNIVEAILGKGGMMRSGCSEHIRCCFSDIQLPEKLS